MNKPQNINEKMLLHGEFLPVSGNLLFLKTSPNKALDAFIRSETAMKFQVRHREQKCSLNDAFQQLFPLATDADKWCFIGTKSEWTLALHNDGDDFGNSLAGLGHWAKCDALLIQYFPAGLPSGNPYIPQTLTEVRAFSYMPFGAEPRLVTVRCHREKQWSFHELGKAFPFEDTVKYSERFKRNRLTLEMLKSYSGHFGIDPFNKDFYLNSAIFATSRETLTSAEREEFMGSWQAYHAAKTGWKVYSIKMVNGIIEKIRLYAQKRFKHEDFDDV